MTENDILRAAAAIAREGFPRGRESASEYRMRLARAALAAPKDRDAREDRAYANGVQACLSCLYAAGVRRDEHRAAWEACEAMWRNRVAATHEQKP